MKKLLIKYAMVLVFLFVGCSFVFATDSSRDADMDIALVSSADLNSRVTPVNIPAQNIVRMGDGIFRISTDFTTRTDTDPDLTFASHVLEPISLIFAKYPNIRSRFIDQIRLLPNSACFTVKHFGVFDPMQVLPLANDAWGMFTQGSNGPEIAFKLGLLHSLYRSDITADISPKPDSVCLAFKDSVAAIVAHEMGHLFTFTVLWCQNPALINRMFLFSLRILEMVKTAPEPIPDESILKHDYEEINSVVLPFFERVKNEIITLARDKGYTGDGSVSKYSDVNQIEWIAEAFSRAFMRVHFGDTLDGLDQAVIDWFNAKDKELAK